jgi:hypothetical protein
MAKAKTSPPTPLIDETLVAFSESRKLPGRPAYSTVYRWFREGLAISGQVIKLEACFIGARLFTSKEAHARFSDRVTAARGDA